MSLERVLGTGLYGLRRTPEDQERPNVLFTSDIPHKIARCVAELHLYQGGSSSRLVELASCIDHFNITLELNALLSRNPQLVPSELVRRNKIFVAKTHVPALDHRASRSVLRFPDVWRSILQAGKADEIFVVTYKLHLARFSVDLANVNDTTITFTEDHDLCALRECDDNLVEQISLYVKHKLLLELRNNDDISIHITSSSTILQDLPAHDSLPEFHDLHNSSGCFQLDKLGASLCEIDTSFTFEKQLVFDEDIEYNNSDDDLRILPSDESGKCTANEDDESDAVQTPTLLNPDLANVLLDCTAVFGSDPATGLGLQGSRQAAPEQPKAVSSRVSSTLAKSELVAPEKPNFVADLENLRHNTPLPTEDKALSGSPVRLTPPQLGSEEQHIDDYIMSPFNSPRKHYPSFSQPTAQGIPLRKKASLSLVDHDEKYGLKYAFKHTDSSVPEYIKDNKKFKFIKVGKVQKFVNMFEEHKETASTPSSRSATRPCSPLPRTP